MDIRAIQFSLLAGRIFFKQVRYHGQNETVLVQDGFITWRYWLRHTQELGVNEWHHQKLNGSVEGGSLNSEEGARRSSGASATASSPQKELPCRVSLRVRGVQWFVYNRSPAYDAIVQAFAQDSDTSKEKAVPNGDDGSKLESQSSNGYTESRSGGEKSEDLMTKSESQNLDEKFLERRRTVESAGMSSTSNAAQNDTALPGVLGILPLGIECGKGAIVLGNQNTRTALTVTFESATGRVEANSAQGRDEYKQVFEVQAVHPVIQFKTNKDYRSTQIDEGTQLTEAKEQNANSVPKMSLPAKHRASYPANTLWTLIKARLLNNKLSSETLARDRASAQNDGRSPDASLSTTGRDRWLGLSRYLEDENNDLTAEQERWKAVEYGQFPTILDSPQITFCMFWDVPGLVTNSHAGYDEHQSDYKNDINGGPPPNWGINIRLKGGTITYGPWADRQRGEIQAIFFPALYKDFQTAKSLSPGQRRVNTELKVFIEIEERVVLRIPTREGSKDGKWKSQPKRTQKPDSKPKKGMFAGRGHHHQTPAQGPGNRPFGWLDVSIHPDSTISLSVDLVAQSNGFDNRLNLDLRGIEVASSVNHCLLLRSQTQTISCKLGNPREWNALRQWIIRIRDQGTQMFLLREHIFLLTDLISDWGSGPSPEFHTYVPFEYTLDVEFKDVKLFMNANDNNIIDNPSDVNDNTFLLLGMQLLKADVQIPMRIYRPLHNNVSFAVKAQDTIFQFLTPPWKTQSTFLIDQEVATLKDLSIDGTYDYFSNTSPALTDTLNMDIEGISPKAQLYGFLIKTFMTVKDNYFGDDIHFRTSEEYQEQIQTESRSPATLRAAEQRSHLSNDLDVILVIKARKCCAQLPSELYSSRESIDLDIHLIEADLRITNYYMDLSIVSSPINIMKSSKQDESERSEETVQISIESLDVNGHRLFGLPPTEPTYVCNWDFDIGRIGGDCSIDFLLLFSQATRCFGFTFDDEENKLPSLTASVLHDVTFLRLKTQPIAIGLRIDQAALLLSADAISVNFNDWAKNTFSDHVAVLVPQISLAIVDADSTSNKFDSGRPVSTTYACMKTALEIRKVSQKPTFEQERHLQQQHILLHDARTRRSPWFARQGIANADIPNLHTSVKIRPPAMAFPFMPAPLFAEDDSFDERAPSLSSESLISESQPPRSRDGFREHNDDIRKATATSFNSDGNGTFDMQPLQISAQDTVPSDNGKQRKGNELSASFLRKRALSTSQVVSGRNSSPHGFSFTSPYKRPYFPLLSRDPDLHHLPAQSPESLSDNYAREVADNTFEQRKTTVNAENDSMMISFTEGIRMFCTPKALFLITKLQDDFQTRNPSQLLDNLQISALVDVLRIEEKRSGRTHDLNLRFYCPQIAANFMSTIDGKNENVKRQESYEFNLKDLTASLRISDTNPTKDQGKTTETLSLHLSFDTLECSASESMEGHKTNQAVIGFLIRQPDLWFVRDLSITAGVQFKAIEIASASRRVDHISALVRQTVLLSEDLADRFSKIANEKAHRLRLLVLMLAQASHSIPDPPFLSATSYVLRSDVEHLRSSDSWKMLSRLRYVLRELPAEGQTKILTLCGGQDFVCPEDAFAQVVETFEKWRAWDPIHSKARILMARLFGNAVNVEPAESQVMPPIKASFRFDSITILVDPGPHQNEICFGSSVIGINLFQLAPSSGRQVASTTPYNSRIEAHFDQIVLRVNWSLFELIENIIQTVGGLPSADNTRLDVVRTSNEPARPINWQVVVSTRTTILNIDTLSLKLILIGQDLQFSFLMIERFAGTDQCLTSLALHAEATSSEIFSRTKPLTLYKLKRPSIVGSRLGMNIADNVIINPWRFVGSGKEVDFQVVANILDITDTVESFVKDECSFVSSWIRRLEKTPSPEKAEPPANLAELPTIHVTLVLEAYLVSMAVLPNLAYRIHGTGGRASIKSGLTNPYLGDIDIDIKDHEHIFSSKVGSGSEELAALQIPPINGRLALDLGPRQQNLILRILVEPILFEASAIHALITAINRPEIVSLGRNFKREVNRIEEIVEDIFPSRQKKAKPVSTTELPLIYDAYITLAGVAIHTSTPDSSYQDFSAELEFNMGRIQMKAANRDDDSLQVYPFPNGEIRLAEVRLRLMRSNEENSISCGEMAIEALLKSSGKPDKNGDLVPSYQIYLDNPTVTLRADTASVVVAIAGHLQDTLKTIKVSEEIKDLGKLGYSRLMHEGPPLLRTETIKESDDPISAALLSGIDKVQLKNIRLMWTVEESIPTSAGREQENLIVTFQTIDLSTRRGHAARLTIQEFQVQMAPTSSIISGRSSNSALLPEVVFNVAYLSTLTERRLAFQAKGKILDLHLTSQFLLPANDLRRSIAASVQQVRTATSTWSTSTKSPDGEKKQLFGGKRLTSLLVDTEFAGAVVYIQGRHVPDPQTAALRILHGGRSPQHGRYNQFTPNNANSSTTLRAPGIAIKVEYKNPFSGEPSLNAETRVDASSNVLYPTVVPLIMEISSSIKEIVGEPDVVVSETEDGGSRRPMQPRFLEDERIRNADPLAVFGDSSLNFGLRICTQEFSLSCQPVARVAATARFEDVYITAHTVRSQQHGKFFSISATFTGLQTAVQHVYSRESTGGVSVDLMVLSLMNSRHVSQAKGISAILNLSPMLLHVNAKQSQDFLLFREIWLPADIRESAPISRAPPTSESQTFNVQRYQQVAAVGAFPWNATVSIAALNIQLDLGQSIGRSNFTISKFWMSCKKSSDWEQNLCIGFDRVGIDSTGRMSGLVELQNFRVRTSIQWPVVEKAAGETPTIQASTSFDHFEIKAAFDYQAFLIARISKFEFLMYNVREAQNSAGDRLVGMLDGDCIQVFCTTSSASQALSLYQAFQRLIQEKQIAFEASLKDIEKFLRRKSSINPFALREAHVKITEPDPPPLISSLKLQTNVVVTLQTINIGVFPSTFFDSQIFKMEALDASARFSVVLEDRQIHSTLGLILGELRIALSAISRTNPRKALSDISVADVVSLAADARGGTILKVPRLVAKMQTWQEAESTQIDYIFRSAFQGKVDVGWNYSRISYIRGMWNNHVRSLAQRLGKPLPQSAVQITGLESVSGDAKSADKEQDKITAVVNVPQSKYQYTALQPPIIETPQLRDMGEATPPLEWIGLHRDRLPNLTHQIVIVALLRVANDIDDAYSRILGA